MHDSLPYLSSKSISDHGAVHTNKCDSLLAVVDYESSRKLSEVYASALLSQLRITHLKCMNTSIVFAEWQIKKFKNMANFLEFKGSVHGIDVNSQGFPSNATLFQ
jgi:hypothetical protein